MNKVYLIGRLADAPEKKTTPSGVSVTTFRIGVNRRFNRDQSDFFSIVTWRTLADHCGKYLVKGQQVAVIGELQTRSYDDKNGIKRWITEVVADEVEFLQKPSGAGSNSAPDAPPARYDAPPMAGGAFENELASSGDVLAQDDNLPF